MEESADVKFVWKLENFCFCDLYPNEELYSPVFKLVKPIPCTWVLFMFPNGYGINKDIGIFLKRTRVSGPKEIRVRFKISLEDSDGFLCPPEAPWMEETFRKKCEWGHKEFIQRSEVVTKSVFMFQDSLTVVCQICFVGPQNRRKSPKCQSSLQFGERGEIQNLCNALDLLYKDSLYSDMAIKGKNRNFNVHKCILKARLPVLYNRFVRSPSMGFGEDFTTEKFLSYAYTGRLDTEDFTPFNLETTLSQYGLENQAKHLISQSNEYVAHTYFELKIKAHSWTILKKLLMESEEIYSSFIKDKFEKICFKICLHKYEDSIWKIKIKLYSKNNDDVFVRCSVSVKDSVNERAAVFTDEHLCRPGTWWLYPATISLDGNNLIFNGDVLSVDSHTFCIHFTFTYPTGKNVSNVAIVNSSHTSITDCGFTDLKTLLNDLEALYNDQCESDFRILVGNREFKVHKCIICARSPYFRAMLENDTLEKRENRVHLKNDELDEQTFQEVVDKVLLFTYCGKFEARSPTFASLLIQAIDMYMIGKSYEDV